MAHQAFEVRCFSPCPTHSIARCSTAHFPDGDIDPVARLMQRAGKGVIFVTGDETARWLRKKWPLAEVISKPFSEHGLLRAVFSVPEALASSELRDPPQDPSPTR